MKMSLFSFFSFLFFFFKKKKGHESGTKMNPGSETCGMGLLDSNRVCDAALDDRVRVSLRG